MQTIVGALHIADSWSLKLTMSPGIRFSLSSCHFLLRIMSGRYPYLVPEPELVIDILHDVLWLVRNGEIPVGALSPVEINLRLFGVRILNKALSPPDW